jgi:hypothetical protein
MLVQVTCKFENLLTALCNFIRFKQISKLKQNLGVTEENTKEIIPRHISTGILR